MTQVWKRQVTIAAGQTVSSALDLAGGQLTGIIIPAEFTGTGLSFQTAVKRDDQSAGTYYDVQNGTGASANFSITTAASKYIPIDNLALTASILEFIKLVSATAQVSDCIITLIIRDVK